MVGVVVLAASLGDAVRAPPTLIYGRARENSPTGIGWTIMVARHIRRGTPLLIIQPPGSN
jgi:hypothetical protein